MRSLHWMAGGMFVLLAVGCIAFVASFFFDGHLYSLHPVTGEPYAIVDYTEEPLLRNEVLAGRLKVTRDWDAYYWQRRLMVIAIASWVASAILYVWISVRMNSGFHNLRRP